MFKLIKRTICFLVIAVIVFFAIALWSGGEKFRLLGEKTAGAIKETSEKLAERADEIKGKKDEAVRGIEKFTGRDKEETQHRSSESSRVKEKKTENGNAEEDGSKTPGNSQHTLWDIIMEKIRALKKG